MWLPSLAALVLLSPSVPQAGDQDAWLRVSDDAALIAQTVAASASALEALLATPLESSRAVASRWDTLSADERKRVLAVLESASAEQGLSLASELADIDDATATAWMKSKAKTSTDVALALLVRLMFRAYDARPDERARMRLQMGEFVASCISRDESLRMASIALGRDLAEPRVWTAALAILDDFEGFEFMLVAQLAAAAKVSVDELAPLLKKIDGLAADDALDALAALSASGNPQTKREASRRLHEKFVQLSTAGALGDRLGRDVAEALAANPNDATLDAFEELLTNEEMDIDGLEAAFAVLVRAGGERRDSVEVLKTVAPEIYADAYAIAFSETGDSSAVDALKNCAAEDEWARRGIFEGLQQIGGKHGYEALADGIAAVTDTTERRGHLAAFDDRPAEAAFARAVELGILDESEAAIRLANDWQPSEYSSLNDLLQAVIGAKEIALDGAGSPAGHDAMFERFTALTNGKIAPTACVETWNRKSADDTEAGYTLSVAIGSRHYEADLNNYDDWYDYERMFELLQRISADLELESEFIQIDKEFRGKSFAFGNAERLGILGVDFNVPLGHAPANAEALGDAFEKRVLEQLRSHAQ